MGNAYETTIHWWKEDQLDRAYWDYYWSQQEIGNWVGVDGSVISHHMQRHGIPVRTTSEAMQIVQMKKRGQSLEDISEKFPDPRIEDSHGIRQSGRGETPRIEGSHGRKAEDDSVPWGKLQ